MVPLFKSLNFQEEGSDEPLDPRLQLPMRPFSTNKYKFNLKGQVKSSLTHDEYVWMAVNWKNIKMFKD